MDYLFDRHRPGRKGSWETIGVTAGHGVNAMAEAFASLREAGGREPPAGEYRYRPEGLAPPQWRYFHYEAGEITILPIA